MVSLSEEEIIKIIDKARAHKSETSIIEFKDARSGIPSDLWRAVSAFSHKPKGGLIVFGIAEINGSFRVVGGSRLAILQEKIVSLLNDSMKNVGNYDLKIVQYENTPLLILLIDETPDERKPCYLYNLSLPRGACVREGNTNRVITDEEMRNFIRNNSVFKFDKAKAGNVTGDSLSKEKIEEFLIKSANKAGRGGVVDNKPTKELMINLGIMDEFEDGTFPTVAGFLIFSKDYPQRARSFSRYVIRCVRYNGDSVASPIVDKLDVEGTLDQQIENAQKFILRNIKESQFSRNEIIAQILKDMDYLEEYGRGIDIVFSRMSEWNLLEPIFKNMANTFKVILLGKIFRDLNDRQIAVWNGLQDKKKITSKECRELFPDASRATIGSDLNKLVSIGLIVPHGSSYNTYYEPKY